MWRYYLYLTIAALLWGGSFVGTKVALSSIQPLTLVFLRYVIGSVIVLIFLRYIKLQKIEAGDLRWLILLSIFEPGLYFLFETYGIKETDPTIAALIIALIPVFVLIIATILGIEKITPSKIGGIVLSVVGVSIISVLGNTQGSTIRSSAKGLFLILLATITASSFTVLLSRLAKKYSSFTLVSFQVVFAVIFYLPLTAIENYPSFRFNWESESLYALFYLGVFPTFFAYLLYTKGLSRVEGSTASLFTNLIPIFTAVISAVLLKTTPSLYTLIGGLLIIAGVSLVTTGRRGGIELPPTT